MAVKGNEEVIQELEAAREALGRAEAAARRKATGSPELTVREAAERFNISEEAMMAFLEAVSETVGPWKLEDTDAARRGAMVATSAQFWENHLGPLLSSKDVRELLGGVSRQRVDELQRARRLIVLREQSGRLRFPAFQFVDGRPLEPLVAAFWTIVDAPASEWTAASWCVAPYDELGGRSPVDMAKAGDLELLARVARQDASRLGW